MSTSKALVEKVDALPYRERWQHMLTYGKEAVSSPTAQVAICELAASPEQSHRTLAAMALRGFCGELPADAPLPADMQKAVTALATDSSSKVYKLVTTLLVERTPSAEALEAVLDAATADQFKLLCETIEAHKTSCPVGMSALLSYSRRTDLPKRKHDLLARHLPDNLLDDRFARTPLWSLPVDVLQKVVLHSPQWAVHMLRQELEEHLKSGAIPPPLLRAVRLSLQVLASTGVKENVKLGLDLVVDMFHRLPVSKDELESTLTLYFNHAPTEMIEYFLNGDGAKLLPLHLPFSEKVRALLESSFSLRCTLSERSVIAWSIDTQFVHGSKAFRQYIYTERRDVITTSDGRLHASRATLLPNPADREREAREAYQAKGMEEDPLERMQYLPLLPFSEAVKLADEYMTNPKPDLRIAAVRHLVGTARLHPEEMDHILNMCVARGKEQDPFRQAMVSALSELPVSVWRETHAAQVQAILTAAYTAKDVSDSTISALKYMLLAIAVHHPEFAGKCLVELYTERPTHRRVSHLWERFVCTASTDAVTRLYNALRPIADTWKNTDVDKYYQFLGELPERFVALIKDELHPFFVKQLNLEDPDPTKPINAQHRSWGYSQLEKYYPQEARSLIPSLLEKDAAWFNTHSIKTHVLRDLQGSWLTPHLKPEAPEQPKDKPSIDLFNGLELFFYRLSPSQQHLYAQSLIEMVKVFDKDTRSQKRFIACFPKIPSASFDDGVGALAAENNEDIFIRDWALVTLGRMQDKASFEELQRAMTDSRQREAVVPIMRRLKRASAAAAIEVLRPALESKLIMVQKEVARFIGDKADPAAFQCLQSFLLAKGDKVQQDALLAVVRGLWNYMDQDLMWTLLDTIVNSPRAAACIAICKIPDRVLVEPWQRQRYAALIVQCLKHSDNSVKIAAMERIEESPQLESSEIFDVVLSFVDRYKPGRLGGMAVKYLLHAASVPSDQVADKLSSTPNPRWLSSFVDCVESSALYHPRGQAGSEKVKEIAALMADRLIERRRLPELACKLVFVLEPASWIERLTRMHSSGLMHPGCVKSAVDCAGDYSPYDDEFIAQIMKLEAEHLRSHPEPFFRRLGLEILEKCASNRGWETGDLKQALTGTYRRDSDPWVRDAAELLEFPGDQTQSSTEEDEL